MKIFTLLLCCVLATCAPAQDAPKSGYETLIAAGKLILPGENGTPSSPVKLAPAENLRRQRLAVARNAPALQRLREALQMPIEAPAITSYDDTGFSELGKFRELARQLRQESDVRLADGDAAGALDSRLTGLELGVSIAKGAPYIGALTGVAIEAVARQDMEPIVAKLDAPAIRAALGRLVFIDSRRITYPQVLAVEKATTLRLVPIAYQDFFASKATTRQLLATPEGRKKAKVSEKDARELIALTPEILTAQVSQIFDAAIARDQLPYQRALQTALPPAPNAFVNVSTDLWRDPKTRFSFERNIAANRLLQAALELRALKLETGAYPATFNAPLDPFSDGKPLVYRREGQSYTLYSVGPDGIDDGGRPFKATRQVFDPDSGTTRTVAVRAVRVDSRGDVLAPVF